jgi:uncharacterized membrane protein YjdF
MNPGATAPHDTAGDAQGPATPSEREHPGPKHSDRSRWWLHPVTVAAVLTFACLPLGAPVPSPTLDASWQLGLSLVHLRGIAAGPGFVFTNGPLGFLAYPNLVWLPGALLGLVYVVATTFAFYFLVCRGLRQWLAPVVAAILTVAVAVYAVQLFSIAELASTALVLWSLALVGPTALNAALPSWVPMTIGAVAALELLVKFGVGETALAVAAIVALSRPPRLRNAALSGASFVVCFLVLWLAAQQSLTNIWEWFRGSLQLQAGYSAAMATLAGFEGKRYWLFLFAVVGVLCVGLWRLVRVDAIRAVPTIAIVVVAAWFLMKEGFTRLDPQHAGIAYLCLGALIAAIPWERRWVPLGLAGFALALSTVVTTTVGVGQYASQLHDLAVSPSHGVGHAATILRATVEPAYRTSELSTARDSVRATYQLPITVAAGLAHREVHADPWAISAVWAYDLPWRPVPVFQTYAAYTSYLDQLNAESLRSRRGPNVVIRQQNPFLTIGRLPAWESPNYMVTLTCSYEMTRDTPGWQVLERTSNACRHPLLIGRQVLRDGDTAHVPTAKNSNDVIVATFGYPTSAVEKLASLLLKPFRLPTVSIDGSTNAFVSGTASQFHLIRVPEKIGTRHITNAGLDIRNLSFPDAEGAVTVRFYELSTS